MPDQHAKAPPARASAEMRHAEEDTTVAETRTAREDTRDPARAAVDDTRSASDSSSVGDHAGLRASSGPRIGRFVVLDELGAGGNGVVVLAYDPTLHRKVAIKVLNGERWLQPLTRGRTQLVAEAHAMARLSHPHVITLHEIGFDDAGAFLVMEYVAGSTLRGWLAAAERTWSEILVMFRAAGQGLVAAHRAGLIHRDFKPDNVLIDQDGRPRVGDFGLAITLGADPAPGSQPGTLPYMAPEQLRGESCDARADQFAYCVALWEALHGSRPFAGTSAAELLTQITSGQLSDPVRLPPDWLRNVVMRGLAVDPGQRWPSIEVLIDALRRDPRAKRRRLAAGLGVAAVTAGTLALVSPSSSELAPCEGAEARLAGVWDPARQVAVHAAFLSTGLPYAELTWRVVDARLRGYAASWVAMTNEACRATRVGRHQSDAVMDLRMACLEQRRSVLGATSALWAGGVDGNSLEHAIGASGQLAPVVECADGNALGQRVALPANPVQVSLIASARTQLDALQAALLTHRLADARRLAADARGRADASGWAPIRAEVAVADGELRTTLDDAGAEARLIEATQLADAAHDDHLRLRALLLLVQDLADHQQRAADALRFADLADGALARLGGDEVLRARLLHVRGKVLFTASQYGASRAALDQARQILTRARGPADLTTLAAIGDLARTASKQGDHAAARKLYEGALAVAVPVFGEDHPQVARLLTNLATEMYDSGDVASAIATYKRALTIDEQVFGHDAPYTALTLQNLARVEGELGHAAVARTMLERALAIRLRTLGPDHPFVATTLGNLAMIDVQQGFYDRARTGLEAALAIKLKTYGPEHTAIATSYDQIGVVATSQRDLPRALSAFQQSAAIRRKLLGPEHDQTQFALGRSGGVLRQLHRCREAAPLLEHAYTVLHKSGSDRPAEADLLVDSAACDLDVGQPGRALAKLAIARTIARTLGAAPSESAELDFLAGRAEWALGHRAVGLHWVRQASSEVGGAPAVTFVRTTIRTWLASHGD